MLATCIRTPKGDPEDQEANSVTQQCMLAFNGVKNSIQPQLQLPSKVCLQ